MTYQAIQMHAPEGAEVLGAAMMAWFDNLGMDTISPILAKYHLTAEDIQPENWYPFSIFDDIYKAVYHSPGGSTALVAVGKASAENLVSRETVHSAENWLENVLPPETHTFTRNVPEGYGFRIEKVSEGNYRFINNTGIPNDLIYGYLWEGLRILVPEPKDFTVAPISGYYRDSPEGAVFEVRWD